LPEARAIKTETATRSVQEPHAHEARYARSSAADEQAYDSRGAPQREEYDDIEPAHLYADDAEAGEYDEHAPPRARRRGLAAVGAVLGVVAIGAAGVFGYRALSGGGSSHQVPVIAANQSPAKIVPAPQQDTPKPSGFDRADRPQGERVVSREEQPIEVRDPKPAAPKPITASSGQPASPNGITALLSQQGVPPAPASAEPRKVKTIPIRPDGTVATDSVATRGVTSNTAGPASRVPVPRPNNAAPQVITPGAANTPTTTASIPVQTASIRPNGNTATPAAPPPAAGTHVVQLSSQKTEADAQASLRSLQSKYSAVLGSKPVLVRKVELGDRGTYYRAQVGPFASAEQANQVCTELKSAGGQCIVQKN
jgi:hypothetical protein